MAFSKKSYLTLLLIWETAVLTAANPPTNIRKYVAFITQTRFPTIPYSNHIARTFYSTHHHERQIEQRLVFHPMPGTESFLSNTHLFAAKGSDGNDTASTAARIAKTAERKLNGALQSNNL